MGNVISEFGRLVLGVGRDIQCTVMPDYTSVDPGIIVQYTGATDANYINGYFYKCTNSGWERTDVQDVSGKANKVAGATTDDLASLTATGDLADSGKKLSDLVLKADVKDVLNSTSTTDPLSANMGHTLGEEINAIVNVYGAKNILPNLIKKPYTDNGGTFTPNSDSSVVVSGTVATQDIYCPLMGNVNTRWNPAQGDYIATGGNATALLVLHAYSGNSYVKTLAISPTTESFTIDYSDYDNIRPFIVVLNGTDLTTPVTVYPMARDARIVDPTYEPYAETNQQLTANKANRSDLATINATGSTNTTGVTIIAGSSFYLNGKHCRALTTITTGATFVEGTNYEVKPIGEWIDVTSSCTDYLTQYLTIEQPIKVFDDGTCYHIFGVIKNLPQSTVIWGGIHFPKNILWMMSDNFFSRDSSAVVDPTYTLHMSRNSSLQNAFDFFARGTAPTPDYYIDINKIVPHV